MTTSAKRALAWGSACLGLAISGGALWSSGGDDLRTALGSLDARVLVVIPAVFLGIVFRGLRLKTMAAAMGERVGVRSAVRITLLGDLWAGISPGRVAGEPARWVALGRLGIPRGRAGAILTGEFSTDVLVIWSLVPAVFLLDLDAASSSLPWQVLLGAATAPFFLALGYVALSHTEALVGRISGLLRRLPASLPLLGGRREVLASELERAEQDWRDRLFWLMRHGKRRWLWAACLGLGHGIARLSLLPTLAWALHLKAEPGSLLLWECVAYYGLAFVPLPGGGGTTEVASLVYLGRGLPRAEAALLLALWRIFDYYLLIGLGGLAMVGRPAPDTPSPASVSPPER